VFILPAFFKPAVCYKKKGRASLSSATKKKGSAPLPFAIKKRESSSAVRELPE
jgi:hypothetical protein